MAKLPRDCSGAEAVKAFERARWNRDRQTGSHVTLVKTGSSVVLIVRVASLEAAEMIKLINNTYRDLTFAFANEVALIAERMGLSAAEMIHAANVDYPRSNVAQPGFGGGPCLEKDALILIDSLMARPPGAS